MKTLSRYPIGIFLISFSTLLFELSLTRVFSVTLWYHFGFLIISTALLGFGASGVVLFVWKKMREAYDLDLTLARLGMLLSLSIVFTFWILQKIPFDPFSLYVDPMQFLYMPVTYILVVLPFFFSGLSLALLFTRHPGNINRLYAFDLIGAGLGCVAIVPFMSWLGGGGSVLIASVFALMGAAVFSGKAHPRLTYLNLALCVPLLWLAWQADQYIPLRISDNKGKFLRDMTPVYTEWNTFSRIDFYRDSSMAIPGEQDITFIIDQGTALTGMSALQPDVKTYLKKFPGDSLYESCLAYIDKVNPEVLVIGSGCGTQVVDALHHGVKKVVAVEINPIINKIASQKMNKLWGNLFHQPEVTLVTDEGRNYVRSTDKKFDAIISTHTISNAAVASGALSLSENYVLTKEAFEDYFDHLKDDGILYFTRPEFQIPRLFATGREVLEEKGVTDVAKHFFAYTYPVPERFKGRKSFYAIFVMGKRPLTDGSFDQMKKYLLVDGKGLGGKPIILYDPYAAYQNVYDSILTAKDLKVLYKNYPFEISPATDNKPFFNHHTRWSSLSLASFTDMFTQQNMGRLALEDRPIAETSLLILLLQAIIISGVFILFPLWRFSEKEKVSTSMLPYLFYFAGLGCGFIMIEIVLIQQFSLLLGNPVYAFAIVLSCLLLFTGLGSYLSGKYQLHGISGLRKAMLVLVVVLLCASFFLTPILRQAIALPMSGRLLLSIFLILPIGILLGIPFPSGIKLISEKHPSLIPWAWGVNGFLTVIGTILALMLSMMIGFQAVLWIALIIYLLSMVMMVSAVNKESGIRLEQKT